MYDESAVNLAKFVDAVYFPPQGRQMQQASLYIDDNNSHNNNNRTLGSVGPPIPSNNLAQIYRQVASCKFWYRV